MRRASSILIPLVAALCCGVAAPRARLAAQTPAPASAPQQRETIDRIVAHVEGDIILSSEVQELAAYQRLVDGHSQSHDELIAALIEQWVVRSEAQESRFPSPLAAEIDAESERIQNTFPNAQAFRERMAAAGLTPQGLRRLVELQFYLERYLDYKFRPAVQIDDDAIARYYQDEFAPALKSQGQTIPPIDDVRDRIREILVQRGISERANSWFDETKSRLQIEIVPAPVVEGKQ
jgi:hypothetical protein